MKFKDKILTITNSLLASAYHILAYSGKSNSLKEQQKLLKTLKREEKARKKLIKLLGEESAQKSAE